MNPSAVGNIIGCQNCIPFDIPRDGAESEPDAPRSAGGIHEIAKGIYLLFSAQFGIINAAIVFFLTVSEIDLT